MTELRLSEETDTLPALAVMRAVLIGLEPVKAIDVNVSNPDVELVIKGPPLTVTLSVVMVASCAPVTVNAESVSWMIEDALSPLM